MSQEVSRTALERAFSKARRGLMAELTLKYFLRGAVWVFPPGAAAVAADRYWHDGAWTALLLLYTLFAALAVPLARARFIRNTPPWPKRPSSRNRYR